MSGAEVLLSSPAEVKALVPDFIFKRAKEVVSCSKLHDISFQGPSLQHSSATCTGSNPGDNYRLSIIINSESSSNPVCQCSCPAAPKAKGNLCKHVVALLLLRTQELAKVAKDQSNAAVLSEFKLVEERLFQGRTNEPTLSDSQATELFIPSDDRVDNDVSTTASSVSPVVKNNHKRVLPSWISGGYGAPKKEVKDTKLARKAGGKKDAIVKEEGETCTNGDGKGALPTRRGKGKSRLLDGGATTKAFVKKQKDAEGERVQDTGSEAEEGPHFEKKPSSRAVAGSKQRKASTSVKNGCPPMQKRRRTRAYVESDLSEEEEPEVLDDECSFEAKEALALTTEDLVNLATEHLETEKSNTNEPVRSPSGASVINNEMQKSVAALKKKGSIFSVQGWNDIATKGLDGKGASYSQEILQRPSTFLGDVNSRHSQASAELGPDSLPVCGDTTKGLDCSETAEKVVDDMLGLFFGPTLSKTINSRLESSQNLVQDVNKSTVVLPEADMLDVILPVSNDSVPQPKKKSSLKDKVMMYLG